ncbi:MAG TPA: hypothetical protein VJU87_08620 [Gemmatimonadaceae bacterium]|nr:hypothetical protein [Gemmatimonadaceae bacterium]
MHISRKLGAVLGSGALAFGAACSQDLNVTNPNNPDVARAIANPGDVQSLAVSSVQAWYVGSNEVDPWVMLNVTGDLQTMNYGNFGARFNNLEPRIAYANDAANGDIEVARDPWNYQYTSLGEANDVLKALAGGLELPGGTDKYKALALWTQAASLMQLALIYDKAFTVDETFDKDTSHVELVPYPQVEAFALNKIDKLIALTQQGMTEKWTYSATEFPLNVATGLDAAHLNAFANTMAAQLLALSPRTAAEAKQVDWGKVLQYTQKGIGHNSSSPVAPFDFTVIGDGGNLWYAEFMGYADLPSWMGVDQALIHKMAPNVPPKYDGTPVAPVAPYDARIAIDTTKTANQNIYGADIVYKGKVIGDPTRGIYMQSPYYHMRYVNVSWQADVSFAGPMPYTLAAENDLLMAEALIRTGGDRQLAADLINYTHVGRGKMPPVLATDSDSAFMAAITYEREVELDATNGFGFFALRHVDELQPGTVRHLPVPATELETLSLPVYTFGGVGNPDMNSFPVGGGLSLSLSKAPGSTKQLELPNGRLMQLSFPPPRHAVRPSMLR